MTRDWVAITAFIGSGILIGCDGATSVDGVIRTDQGRPLPGVEVRMTYRSRTGPPVVTDEKGSYLIGVVHEPRSGVPTQLSVAAVGFEPVTVDLVGTASYRCDIRLHATVNSGTTPRAVPRERTCTRRQ